MRFLCPALPSLCHIKYKLLAFIFIYRGLLNRWKKIHFALKRAARSANWPCWPRKPILLSIFAAIPRNEDNSAIPSAFCSRFRQINPGSFPPLVTVLGRRKMDKSHAPTTLKLNLNRIAIQVSYPLRFSRQSIQPYRSSGIFFPQMLGDGTRILKHLPWKLIAKELPT